MERWLRRESEVVVRRCVVSIENTKRGLSMSFSVCE